MSETETETAEKQLTDEEVAEEVTEEAVEDSIFSDRKHLPIFPTNLFEFGLKDSDAETFDKCLPVVYEKGDSDLANWVTPHDLNRLPEFNEATELIKEATYQVLRFSSIHYDELLITSLRGYRFSEPQSSNLEVRPNNLLSGLLALKMEEKSGRVTFFDPRPQAWIIKPPISQASIFNSDAFSMDFKPNKIWVFPSWLQYQVSFPREMKEEAVYLSWTCMVRGGGSSPKTQ